MSTVTLRPAGAAESVEVRVEQTAGGGASFLVHVGDRATEAEIEFIAENRGWLRIGGEVVPFFATTHDESVSVWLRGREYRIETVRRTARRAGELVDTAAGADVIAPMPGTVLRIDVAAGDTVDAGQSVAVMESMKMEMSLPAPRAGHIRTIGCKVGELVEMGRVLVSLEPLE